MTEDEFTFEALKEKPSNEFMAKYRLVFSSDMGRAVLADILVNFCHFGEYLEETNEALIGQHNVGVSILRRMGVFLEGKEAVVNAILSVPIRET